MTACQRLAGRRQASSPNPATVVWISDSMLRRSFLQFQRRLIASSRVLSLHRGPLESRRRLGKRHMGAVMSSPPPYRALWHFEVMGNLKEWTWEAPTSPTARREKESRLSLSNLGTKLVRWLEASDFDKPFLQPPADVLDAAHVGQAHVGLSEKIADMRTAICLVEEVDKQTLDRWAQKFRRNLRSRIASGHITVDELIMAMEPLDAITWAHIANDELAQSFTTTIQTHIVSTLGRMRITDTDDMYLEAWLAMVDKVFSMPASNATFTVLRYLVKESSLQDRHQLPPTHFLKVGQTFLLTQTNRDISSSGWLLRFARFAQMLESLSTSQRSAIDPGLMLSILHRASAAGPEKARDLRYSWLLLQAHFEFLPAAAFNSTLMGFLDSCGPLDEYQSWQLAITRLMATGAIDSDLHRSLVVDTYSSSRSRWLSLAVSVSRTARGDDGLRDLCDILRAMQCPDTLAESLISSNGTGKNNKSLRTIQRIVTHPHIDHRLIWNAIDTQSKAALRFRRSASNARSRSHSQIKSLLSLVDKMALWYQTAGSLSSRQAFRGIELCVKAQRTLTRCHQHHYGQVSPSVLTSLTEIITRDMENGFGRTERLEYLLRIISEQQGPEASRKMRHVLQTWRQRMQEHSGSV